MDKFNCSVYEVSESIENMIAEGAVVPLCVSGNSMNPFFISRRDIVYLKLFSDHELKRNKILLYKRSDGSLVLHRVRKVLQDGKLKMNGDAQSWCETISKEQIIAIVSEIERKGKIRNVDSVYWSVINNFWYIVFPLRSMIMRVWLKVKRIKNQSE